MPSTTKFRLIWPDRPTNLTSISGVIRCVSVDLLGDAEICDFDRFVDRHEKITGLNVFMNHILTMEVLCQKRDMKTI